MFNLVKNELYKLFHKKSTIIVLIIMIGVCLLNNFIMYKYDNQGYYYDYGETPSDVKNYLATTEMNKMNIDEYIYKSALNATFDAMGDYYNYPSSWQYQAYFNKYNLIAYKYYSLKYAENIDDLDTKEEMQEIKNHIDSGDWRYFVNEDIKELKEEKASLEEIAGSLQRAQEKLDNQESLFVLDEKIKLNEYRLKENIALGDDYLNDAIMNIEHSLYSVSEYKYDTKAKIEDYRDYVNDYYVNKYILENKADLNNAKSVRSFLVDFFDNYQFIILVFIVMLAGSIVSEEFNKGTIKALLVLPYKRSQILLSKFIAITLMLLFGVVYMYVLQIIIGGLFFGFSSLSLPYVVYNFTTGSTEVVNLFKFILLDIVTALPRLFLFATLAFALSTIINNTAFAIAITFCGTIGESLLRALYFSLDLKILNYFVTNNWHYKEFLFGGISSYGVSLTHAIIVCIVYFLIMMIVSFIVFKRKDIKNI